MPATGPQVTPASMAGVKRFLAIFAIGIGYVLNPLNGSLAVTAYPQLSEFFDVPYAHMSAMVMYFMAATAIGQPLAGALGDLLGRKNIFLAGIVGFTVASGMAAGAETFGTLLAWRVGQAAFSGVIMANGTALIAQVAPKEKIGSYVGLLNSAFVGSTLIGFTLGGVLLQAFDWPILFQLNVPVGIVAFVLALFFIPRDTERTVRFTALSFIGLPVLPLALGLQALVQDEPVLPFAAAFVITTIAVGFSIVRSRKSREQLRSVGTLPFNLGCLILLFTIALHFAMVFTLPAWAYASLGIESAVMGLYFSIIAGAQVFCAPLFGKVVDLHGDRWLRLYAAVAIGVALLILMFLLNQITLALGLGLLGSGFAAAQLIAQRTSLLSAPEQSRALAMGIFSSYRSVGGLAGNALAAALLASYATITPAAGVEVLEWGFVLFLLPLAVALYGLRHSAIGSAPTAPASPQVGAGAER